MKTLKLCKSFIMTALILVLGGVATGCLENEDPQLGEVPELKLSVTALNFTMMPNESQSFHISMTGAGAWTVEAEGYDSDVIEINPSYGTESADVEVVPSPTPEARQIPLTVSLYGEIVGRQVLVAKETVFVNQTADGSAIEPNDGLSPESAFTVAEVIAKAKEIGDTESDDMYYFKGIISEIGTDSDNTPAIYKASYGNATFYIKDSDTSDDKFYCYRILYLGNKKWTTGDTNIKVGDEVIVRGKITNYKGNTPETVQGSAYLYMLNGVTSSDGSGDGGNDNPGGDDSKIGGFESQSAFVASGTNTTDYWYNIDGYTVNGQKATGVKLGKSGTSGVYTTSAVGVTGDKVLSLYGVAWSGKSATLYIRVNGGGEVDGASSTALKANSTATGSGALALTVTDDDYYTFKLKNLTASSTITLATTDNFAAADVEGRAILARIRLTDTDEGPATDSGSTGGDVPSGGEGTTPETAITVAQAIAVAQAAGETATAADYYVKGVVSKITEIDTGNFGNATFEIIDAGNTSNVLTIYRVYYLNKAKWTANDSLSVGDEVVVCGKLINFKGNTPEITTGGYVYQHGSQVSDGGNTGGDNTGGNTGGDSGNTGDTNGNGTKDNPYTVADLMQLYNENTASAAVWVKGTILGSCTGMGFDSFSDVTGTSASNTNIVIGDNTNKIPVQLPAGAVRNALNLQANPANLGKEVALYGTIEKYFSVAGFKNVTDYVLDGASAGDNVPTDAKAVTVSQFNAAAVSTTQLYELTGKVSNITNGEYGNFDLVDDTGSVYVYGLTKAYVASNDKSFASLGVGEGDKIKIHGFRGDYNGKVEVMNAWLIEIVEKAGQSGGNTGGDSGNTGGDNTGDNTGGNTPGTEPETPGTGTESVVYTLTPAEGSNNGYAANCDVTVNGITWNLTGNSTMIPWRLGGKTITDTDRALYSKTPISNNISKISIQHGTANITVNSFTVIVAKDADFSNVVYTTSPEFAASSTSTVTRPDGQDWSGCYYKFVYNVTETSGSNKYVQFMKAEFTGK